MANKVYEIVTNTIIAKIEEAIQTGGLLPWQKPWYEENVPVNHITQKPYRGVNLLLLDGGEYLTWSQLCDLQKHSPDLKLKKGSKAHMVVFFSLKESEKETQNKKGETECKTVRIPFLRYYKVFNIADVEGLQPCRQSVNYVHSPIDTAEEVVKSYVQREGVRILYKNGNKACYSPNTDTITVPEMKQYKHIEEYYSTLFHEFTHSTGLAERLDRLNGPAIFGSADYSKEELIAEIGAAMLCGHCGIDTVDSNNNSIAYLRGWLKALKDDVTLVVCAASKAQKAADLVLGTSIQLEHYSCR